MQLRVVLESTIQTVPKWWLLSLSVSALAEGSMPHLPQPGHFQVSLLVPWGRVEEQEVGGGEPFPGLPGENEETPTHDVRPCTRAKSEAAMRTPRPADRGGPRPGRLLAPPPGHLLEGIHPPPPDAPCSPHARSPALHCLLLIVQLCPAVSSLSEARTVQHRPPASVPRFERTGAVPTLRTVTAHQT